jgi:hypothetical protein
MGGFEWPYTAAEDAYINFAFDFEKDFLLLTIPF